jgi:hypothetical protein
VDPELDKVLAAREADVGALAERILDRIDALDERERAGYAQLPREELRVSAEGNIRLALAALRADRGPSTEERAALREFAAQRARQGVPLEALLRVLRFGGREVLVTIRDAALEAGLDVGQAIEIADAVWEWIDEVSVELVGAHRRAELMLARQTHERRAAFVLGLVGGSLSPQAVEDGAAAFGMDARGEYHVVCADEGVEALLAPSHRSGGVTSVIDDTLVAVVSQPPAVELPVAAGIGPATALSSLRRSFVLAMRAQRTARAFGLVGLHDLPSLSLRAAVVADGDVGELLAERYCAPVLALGDFGREVLRSLRCYLEHEQNVDAAAAALFVHPNTLRHRLARFEETTGSSLRRVSDLAEIWWVLQLESLTQARA